ncbi:unnamed protein product [Scytosiphon promiscuus]
MTDCRRFVGFLAAVTSLSCVVQCFVAQSSLRPSAQLERQQRCRSSSARRNSGSRSQNNGAVGMMSRGSKSEEGSSLSGGSMDRRQALSKVWKAALSVSAVGTAAVASGGAKPAEAGVAEDIGGFLLPPQNQSKEIVVGEVDKEVSFEDFERALLRGDVQKCEFFGSNFDKAVIVLKDGTRALIGEGYPEERAFSDDSPMKVVGLLRNAGVPFTTQFRVGNYNKPRAYKTSETMEAESRQKSEDAALEALMAQ